jgi:hypothetical protein
MVKVGLVFGGVRRFDDRHRGQRLRVACCVSLDPVPEVGGAADLEDVPVVASVDVDETTECIIDRLQGPIRFTALCNRAIVSL